MGKHALEAVLYQKLFDFFAENDFNLRLDLRQFRRDTTTGFDNVIFSLSPYVDELWIDVNFGIRNEAIENTAQQFLTNRLDFRPDANTLLTTIGRFRQRNYFRYKVSTQPQLEEACADIKRFFSEKGFNFFNTARNLADIDLILNEHPRQRCPFVNNPVHRCFKGLVTARLAESAQIETLYTIYKEQLSKGRADLATLGSFDRLQTYLTYYSSN